MGVVKLVMSVSSFSLVDPATNGIPSDNGESKFGISSTKAVLHWTINPYVL